MSTDQKYGQTTPNQKPIERTVRSFDLNFSPGSDLSLLYESLVFYKRSLYENLALNLADHDVSNYQAALHEIESLDELTDMLFIGLNKYARQHIYPETPGAMDVANRFREEEQQEILAKLTKLRDNR